MTKEKAQVLKDTIDPRYHKKDDYPPFARAPCEDRDRYRKYIFTIIDELTESKKENR